jgi:hypothetical protein
MGSQMPNGLEELSVHGGRACIAIRYDGTLEQLASILEGALNLKVISIESSEDPPHRSFASAEAMGWEMWLEENSIGPSFNFHLRIETMHSLKESVEGRMFDLSPWLARLITCLCDVHATAVTPP